MTIQQGTVLKNSALTSTFWQGAITALLALVFCAGCSSAKVKTAEPAVTTDAQLSDSPKLVQLSAHGDIEGVKNLIRSGTDVNAMKSHDGITALMAAARKDHVAIVEQLLIAGADVKPTDSRGSNALHYATLGGSAGSIALLVKKGTILEAKDSFDLTPLMMAARFANLATVRALLSAGASVETADSNGWTPLFFSIPRGDGTIFEALLDKSPPLDRVDSDGDTLLNVALQYNQPVLIKRLIEAGSPLGLADRDGNTPLHHAVMDKKIDYVSWLVAARAPLDVKNKDGQTPLMIAGQFQDKNIFNMLTRESAKSEGREESK
ncbi:MAG: ankyrin repeat domain-containing protein [Bdellovibrionales bacterium]